MQSSRARNATTAIRPADMRTTQRARMKAAAAAAAVRAKHIVASCRAVDVCGDELLTRTIVVLRCALVRAMG